MQLVGLGYVLGVFALMRGLTGRTLGTSAVGLVTVDEQGEPIGVGWALVRMIAGLVDWFPYCIPGLLGLILILSTKGHRRVGDMAAKSFVVPKDQAGRAVIVPGLSPLAPVRPGRAVPDPAGSPGAAGQPGQPAARQPRRRAGQPADGVRPGHRRSRHHGHHLGRCPARSHPAAVGR